MSENKKMINVSYPNFNVNEENPYQEEMDKLLDISLTEASTTRTIKNITECLTKSLRSKYGIKDKEELKNTVNEILKIHGMSSQHFDPISTISKLTFGEDKNVNNISVDDNANKTSINMEGICGEAFLPYKKVVGYDYLYQTIKELYGKEEAKKCCASMYDLSLALNDSTKITIPYCYCIDASKLVIKGRDFGQVHSSPAHRVNTYISILCDTIREISFCVAGAIAVGSFFLDVAHLAIYKERITLDDLRTDKKTRKYISNCLQQFIHSVNHYSRNSVESPFTNVSCFDRDKLINLISDENYGWYFPKKAAVVEDNEIANNKEAYREFVLDYIEELQEIYIDIFDAGDPLRNGLQFPFPVTTVNLSINVDENGNRKLTNPEDKLYNYIVGKDISKYNIYCSEGTKVASCCLGSTTKVLARVDGYVKYLTVAQLFNIWDVSQNDKVIEIMGDNGFVKVVKGYKLDNPNNTLNKITLENGCVISTTLDHPSVKIENGEIVELKSEDLKVGDIIPVSKNIQYECLNGGTFELGRYVGLFGAEGMFDRRRDNVIYFCFNTNEKEYQQFIKDFSLKNFGADSTLEVSSTYENSSRVRVMSRSAYGLIRDFFVGDLCTEKRLTSKIFNMSEEFRKGFLTGFIEGDGYTANSDRSDYGSIHINNKELARDIVALANTVNIKCSLRIRPTSQVVNILHNDKMKLDVLKDWHNGNGSKQKSTVLNDFGDYYGVKIESIEQVKTRKNCSVYDFTVESDNHLFQIANGIITHNCRLLSDAEMLGLGEGVNSFGGSQISLGSHRVVTTDMFRAACEAESYDDFKKILTERVEESAKILQAHRVLIHKLEKCGTQPWITNGWINMSHLFSTFGCVGYVEADKLLKYKFNHKDFDYMKDFLVHFNNECKRVANEYKMIWNLEAIPAEGMAPKLAKADMIIFGNDENKYMNTDFEMPQILANQWCSLWEDHTIYEKMKRDGEIQRLMTGGSIVHINIDSKITKTQAKKLIEDSVKYGMAHFALNAVYVECKECGHVVKGYLDECPNCHSHDLNKYSRIIGYFSKINGWSPARRKYDFPRRKFLKAKDIINELGE